MGTVQGSGPPVNKRSNDQTSGPATVKSAATKAPASNLIHLDDLQKLPPIDWLPETHIVAQGLNVLFGDSGAYKSFYALDGALRVAKTATVSGVN